MPRFYSWKLLGLSAFVVALSVEGLVQLLRRRRKPLREVLFFPAGVTCTDAELHPERPVPCTCKLPHVDSSLNRLLRHLLSARLSLELCVFSFSSLHLGRAVLMLHERGVRVRVITDSDYMAVTGSQIGWLRKAGISVRHDQDAGYMHHKFAVVDKKILITGSLNWTSQAIQGNKENILVMDDTVIVQAFVDEFEKLWELYNPTTYDFFPNGINKVALV
nr:Phospholipase D Family Member 6 [Cynops orientalis]